MEGDCVSSKPPEPSAEPVGPSAEYATFTSAAYGASNDGAATRATVEWLETQSLMPFIREVAERSLARLAIESRESVLDVGCGTGVFLPRLGALTGAEGRVVGLDHAPQLLAEARARLVAAGLADRIELIEGDALRLPFGDATFDAAHCERLLMHLDDPAVAIREMLRVVRPGGRAVVAEVFAAGATMEHPDLETHHEITVAMMSGIHNVQMGIQLRRLLIESGFVDVDGEVVGYFESALDQDEAEEYAKVARELAARGRLDPVRAEAAVEAIEERRAKGTYCGLATIFVVSGRVPDRPEAQPGA